MRHDEDCEVDAKGWLTCHCASRAYALDPVDAKDEAVYRVSPPPPASSRPNFGAPNIAELTWGASMG